MLKDGFPDRRWSEGDRVARLRNCYVVLSSVLAEKQSLFSVEQACQVQSAYRHINFKFHTLVSFLFWFCTSENFDDSPGHREVTLVSIFPGDLLNIFATGVVFFKRARGGAAHEGKQFAYH